MSNSSMPLDVMGKLTAGEKLIFAQAEITGLREQLQLLVKQNKEMMENNAVLKKRLRNKKEEPVQDKVYPTMEELNGESDVKMRKDSEGSISSIDTMRLEFEQMRMEFQEMKEEFQKIMLFLKNSM